MPTHAIDSISDTGRWDHCYLPYGHEILGDVVRPIWGSDPDSYMPASDDAILFEFSEVASDLNANSDEFEHRAIQFIRKWGLLNTPMNVQTPAISDSLSDIWRTSREIENSLHRIQAEDLKEAWWQIIQMFDATVGVSLVYQDGVTGQENARQGSVRYAYTFRSLRGAIYWHAANYLIGEREAGKCVECGRLFHRTDARQRFCPPKDHWGQGRSQSRCGLRFRARKKRRGG